MLEVRLAVKGRDGCDSSFGTEQKVTKESKKRNM